MSNPSASARRKAIELEVPVALDAGIGCPSGSVVGDIGLDDVAFEVLAEIEDVVLDAESICDSAGVVDVGNGATAGVGRAAPELHGDTDDLVTGIHQQGSRNRRVDPARHGDHHRAAHASPPGHQPPPWARAVRLRADVLEGRLDVGLGGGVAE